MDSNRSIKYLKNEPTETIYKLYEDYFPESAVFMRKKMKQKGKYFITARDKNKIVGAIGVMVDPKTKNNRLLYIVVHPEYRRQGIATKLTNFAVWSCVKDGCDVVDGIAYKKFKMNFDILIEIGFKKEGTMKFNYYYLKSDKINIKKIEEILNG